MKAIITRNDQTAVLELPTSRMELAGSLSRIGIRTPAHIIPCSDEEDDYIKVKLFGESDFENELTALVTPKDSLGSVNTTLDLYRELPQTQKEKLKAELSQNPPDSLSSLCRKVMDFQPKYVTEDYYFPLTVSVYEYSEYGDLDYDSDCELDGRFANDYADEIKAMFDSRLSGKIYPVRESTYSNLKQLIPGRQGQRVYSPDGAAVCLMSQGGGQGAKTGLYLIDMNENPKLTPLARCITARQDSGISNRKGEHSGVLITGARAILTPERLKVRQCGRRFKGPDEPMYALTTQDVHGVILLNGIIRRLMPIECFRLQGFADNQFQTLADNGISDSQLYKMAGNSVTTNVVTAIAEKLAWEISQLPNETEETT